MAIEKTQVEAKLATVIDPNMETDLVSSKAVRSIEVSGDDCSVDVLLGYPAAGYFDALKSEIEAALASIDGIGQVSVTVSSQVKSHAIQQNLKPLEGIKNIIAVASGKGGVGFIPEEHHGVSLPREMLVEFSAMVQQLTGQQIIVLQLVWAGLHHVFLEQ